MDELDDIMDHIITDHGVAQTNLNCNMINQLIPKSINQLRGVLGLIAYYRRFIKNYATPTHALMKLLKKGTLLWFDYCLRIF